MRDLLNDPAWRPEDLGVPLPDDPHAVSVAMPLWEHVVGYEEGDPAVIERLQCGYPRFLVHPIVQRLFEQAEGELTRAGERLILLPSPAAAERCRNFIGIAEARVESWKSGLEAVIFAEEIREKALKFWRFCGDIVSSRRAESVLNGISIDRSGWAPKEKEIIRNRLAELTGQNASDVFLYPSGIAAIFAAHQVTRQLNPGRKTAQIEFPYVDVLKVQEQFGCGVDFLPNCELGGVPGVEQLLKSGSTPSGVFCEIPSNPQLRTVDLAGLSKLLRPAGIPLVTDDTIATAFNIDCFQHADIVSTSLTKYFSGTGDVMAGGLILNRDSPLHDRMAAILSEIYVDDLWGEDAVVLERNSRDFPERMAKINAATETLVDAIAGHPAIDQIWFPKTATREFYDAIRREGSTTGFGGLFSVLLRDPEKNAARFYDRLRFCKGPSLGTNYSLVCPYMLLAHYPELDWCDGLGIERHLVRFSIGLEEPEDLIERVRSALDEL